MQYRTRMLVQVTIYRRVLIGRNDHAIYRNLSENTGSEPPSRQIKSLNSSIFLFLLYLQELFESRF